MNYLVAITAGAVAFTAIDSADAQSNARPAAFARAPAAIVKSVTEADLRALVLAEGHKVDAMHVFEGPSVRGKTKDGVLFVLIGTACNVKGVSGCQGIMMQLRYDADDKVTTEGINSANIKEAALSSWWDKTGKTVGFTRYVVLDDGVTWMNIRQNLRVMLSVAPGAIKQVWPN